jgi:ketosteroid isomerase-like protein
MAGIGGRASGRRGKIGLGQGGYDEGRFACRTKWTSFKRVYDRFNPRDIETVLAAMHEDVVWANGMEGGHVHGRDEVRNYWTRQWAMIDPYVEPVAVAHGPEGEVVVEVHQVVRDLNGNLLADRMVGHVFRIETGLVKRFDIRGA